MKTPDDIARALEFAAALLGEARQFPDGPRDAAALDVLAAAIADRRVILQADVLEEIRSAWERAGTGPLSPETTASPVEVLKALTDDR